MCEKYTFTLFTIIYLNLLSCKNCTGKKPIKISMVEFLLIT